MNYIKHLTGFFDRIIQDPNLNPTHISLYVALFQFWNINRFQNPISITRGEVMRISKISSKATYHKCMRDLNGKGYIKYEPSFNPFKGSMVILFNLSEEPQPVQKTGSNNKKILSNNGQVVNKQGTSSETSIEQALVPSINNINNTNNTNISNLDEQAKKIEKDDYFLKSEATEKEKKLREKKKSISDSPTPIENNHKTGGKEFLVTSSAVEKPTSEKVKAYFLEQHFPEIEAFKFFNYFSSNGWLVGGKTPMVNWQAAAQNWILNAPKFIPNEQQPNRAKHLNTGTDKDYSEPL